MKQKALAAWLLAKFWLTGSGEYSEDIAKNNPKSHRPRLTRLDEVIESSLNLIKDFGILDLLGKK